MLSCLILCLVAASPTQATTMITLNFDQLYTGSVETIGIEGEAITAIHAGFLNQQYIFLPKGEHQYVGLINAPLDTPAGLYRLSILITYQDGTEDYQAYDIQVVDEFFGNYDVTIPSTRSDLLDPDVLLDEYHALDRYLNIITDDTIWLANGMIHPLPGRGMSAMFGTLRRYNSTVTQRHTGIDVTAPEGTPFVAAASGEVVFNDFLPIRGHYLLINAGAGVYMGYAHLSKSYVEVGQVVQQGDLLGEVGTTGRSTGAHLHWETALGGTWVDPTQMLAFFSNQ